MRLQDPWQHATRTVRGNCVIKVNNNMVFYSRSYNVPYGCSKTMGNRGTNNTSSVSRRGWEEGVEFCYDYFLCKSVINIKVKKDTICANFWNNVWSKKMLLVNIFGLFGHNCLYRGGCVGLLFPGESLSEESRRHYCRRECESSGVGYH